ncbi:hypothetical protein WA158_001783 [Blastocystis sp. Blastoise]
MRNSGELTLVYSGESSNLRNYFVFRDESTVNMDQSVDYKVCLDGHTDYNLELLSENSIAWAQDSYVILIYNQITIVNTRLNIDDNGKKTISFNLFSILDSNNHWKYSTSVDAASWKESVIEEWGEDCKNKEIKNSGITTFFRKDITVDNSFSVLQLSIKSQSGFIVYVNGIQIYTYLLPEYSNITQYTPSQSLEDIPSYKQILIPKELLSASTSLTTLKIAIELHTTADHPELLSSFDILSYTTTNSIDYLNILSPLSIRCSTSHPLSPNDCNSILHYNNNILIPIQENHASFYISTISPLYINGYKMKFNNNNIPKEWRLFGSNDEDNNWILLDSVYPITNITIHEIISPHQQYKYYKLDFYSSSSSISVSSIQLLYLDLSSFSNSFDIKQRKLQTRMTHIRVHRQTRWDSSYELVVIKTEDGTEIASLIQEEKTIQDYDYYGTSGIWSFEVISNIDSLWYPDSNLTVSVIDDSTRTSITVAKLRPIYTIDETYYINTDYSILMKSTWKYKTYDLMPTEWYGSSVDDSTWSTMTGGNSISSSTLSRYFIFRKTIPVPTIRNQKTFVLNYKVLSNSKIYINNHEVIVYGFQDGYEQSTDRSTIIEQTTTGPLSFLDNQNTITISVLIFDKQHNIGNIFDASLLMLIDNNKLPVYGDFYVTEKGQAIDCTDMFNLDFRVGNGFYDFLNEGLKPITITTLDGYKHINRYCLSMIDQYNDIPYSWTVESIDQNGIHHLHSNVSNAFNDLHNSRTKCFMLSNITAAINTLEFRFTDVYDSRIPKMVYVAEIDFFVDDITPETLPAISPSSNPYTTYDNTTISVTFDNAEYYHDFTISPPLPYGVTLDPLTGFIYGIIHGNDGSIQYTIHAISMFNEPYEYLFTIHIKKCLFPNSLLNIQLNYDNKSDYLLIYGTKKIAFDDKGYFHPHKEGHEDYNICLIPPFYCLYLFSYPEMSNTTSYLYVDNVFYDVLNSTRWSGELNLAQLVDSSKMPITYSYDNITPPKHWNTNLFNDNVWSTVSSSSSLPDVPNDSITQYYRLHYYFEKHNTLGVNFNITISTYAGMIIYLNGVEIRRVNMNNNTILEYNTLASSEYHKYKPIRSIITTYMNYRTLAFGDNVIAVEIHKYNNIIQPTHGLDIIMSYYHYDYYYALDKGYSPQLGEWSVNGETDPDHPLINMYDGNYETYTSVNRQCINTTFTYTYPNDTYVSNNFFDIYLEKLYSKYEQIMNVTVEASNDNWNTYTHISAPTYASPYPHQDTFIRNHNLYNSYRFRVTRCEADHDLINENKLSVFEARFDLASGYTCNPDGWPVSFWDDYSYKVCPQGYTSNARGKCSYERLNLDFVEGENACVKIVPSLLFFKVKNIEMIINREYEQYYTIDALDADITISPSLPKNIILDNTLQRIYGTPTSLFPNTTYTLSYKSRNNIIETYTLSILVKEPYCLEEGNWSKTYIETTSTIPCPDNYKGQITRYCNINGNWEKPNLDECIQCIGTAYFDGKECKECENGIITSLDGNNIACTPCSSNTFIYNNECFPNDATCPAVTINLFIYPETRIKKIAVVNCTNENQYGYYQIFCDYISNIPTWSNDINRDFCYPIPSLVPGKALESLEFSIQMNSPLSDVFSIVLSLARVFINTYAYKLTDLFLTTNYTINDESFINHVINLPNSVFYHSFSLINKNNSLHDLHGYCQHPFANTILIPFNYYYSESEIIGSSIQYTTYFCMQHQLEYYAIPVKTVDILNNEHYGIIITFKGIQGVWISYDIQISIYRSILFSINVPLYKLRIMNIKSYQENDGELSIYISIVFPEDSSIYNYNNDTWINKELLEEKLSIIIPFTYSSLIVDISNQIYF